jgi:hypothetical protein
VIEPGDGIGREAKEHNSGVAVGTSRGRDAGIVAEAEPAEASVQLTAAGSPGFGRQPVDDADAATDRTALTRGLQGCAGGLNGDVISVSKLLLPALP